MKILFIIFSVISFANIYGQSLFLEKGESGFEIGGDLSTYEDINLLGGNISYSIYGIFDIKFSILNRMFSEKKTLTATMILPSISFYTHKQDEDIPFSFAVGTGYGWQVYSTNHLNTLREVIEGNVFMFEATLSKYFAFTKSIRIQPTLNVKYEVGEFKYANFYRHEEVQDFVIKYNYALPIVFISKYGKYFSASIITPQINTSKEVTTFGLGLAFILSTN